MSSVECGGGHGVEPDVSWTYGTDFRGNFGNGVEAWW